MTAPTAAERARQQRELGRAVALARRLERHDRWDRAELDRFVASRVRAMAAFAAQHSPFYRELYAGVDLQGSDLLGRLPIVTKRQLAEHWDLVVTDPRLTLDRVRRCELGLNRLLDDEFHVMRTGGTTGEPLYVACTRGEWRNVMSTSARAAVLMGFPPTFPRLRVATAWSASPSHMSARIAASASSMLYRRLALPVSAPTHELVRRLQEFQPHVLGAYPSLAGVLASEQLAGRLSVAPRVVFTNSEQLLPDVAARVERAWGRRPYNTYATTETGPVALECEARAGMHVLEHQTVLESVDESGRAVPDGTPGHSVVATNLWSRTLPFLRYEIGDRVTLTREPCRCGRPYARLLAVDGRTHDVLHMPGTHGGTIDVVAGQLLAALDDVPGMSAFQVTWDGERLEVGVVAPHSDVAAHVRCRVMAMAARLEVTLPVVAVRSLDDVERDPDSGKVRLVRDLTRSAMPSTPPSA